MNEHYADDNGFMHFYDPDRDKGSMEPPKDWNPLWTCDRLLARVLREDLTGRKVTD